MKIESLNCPNCGAPLDVKPGQEYTICLYCDSSIRISDAVDDNDKRVTHTGIPKDIMNEIKQLIISGRKNEAIELYRKSSGTSEPEAAKAVQTFFIGITNRIILNRPLNTKGIIIILICFLVLFLSGYILISGILQSSFLKILFWLLLVYSAFNILSLMRSIIMTIKFIPAKLEKASVLKFARIGEKKNLTFFRVLLEVRPSDGESYQTQTNIIVRTNNISRLETGTIINVKYLPDDRNNVLAFAKELTQKNN